MVGIYSRARMIIQPDYQRVISFKQSHDSYTNESMTIDHIVLNVRVSFIYYLRVA